MWNATAGSTSASIRSSNRPLVPNILTRKWTLLTTLLRNDTATISAVGSWLWSGVRPPNKLVLACRAPIRMNHSLGYICSPLSPATEGDVEVDRKKDDNGRGDLVKSLDS